jgi:coatomer subunit beta'
VIIADQTLVLQVSWSATGTLVAIASTDSLYLLRFDRDAYTARLDSGIEIGDEGVEEAFDLVTELSEKYVCPSGPVVPH